MIAAAFYYEDKLKLKKKCKFTLHSENYFRINF